MIFSKDIGSVNTSGSLLIELKNIDVKNKVFDITSHAFVSRVNKNFKEMCISFLVGLKLSEDGNYFNSRFSKYNRFIGVVDEKAVVTQTC
ncbi:hypothetical protein YERSI8AC_150016 [Enterobacterales bacterium 8AC]|nr:hypothetical protein YERSI8AC_150016 [Enterobacterales bacterium 8AC]